MKTILLVVLLTIGFIVSMSFIEAKRTENLNKINLEYQQSLKEINNTLITKTDDDDEDEEEDEKITVTISGAVKKEGEYTFDSEVYLSELLDKAVLKANADSDCYNLYYCLQDEDTIYIPTTNNDNKISINTADANTLDLLPGIGATLAARIVAYRDENGEFELLDNIKNVEGIGTSAFNKIKDYIKL